LLLRKKNPKNSRLLVLSRWVVKLKKRNLKKQNQNLRRNRRLVKDFQCNNKHSPKRNNHNQLYSSLVLAAEVDHLVISQWVNLPLKMELCLSQHNPHLETSNWEMVHYHLLQCQIRQDKCRCKDKCQLDQTTPAHLINCCSSNAMRTWLTSVFITSTQESLVIKHDHQTSHKRFLEKIIVKNRDIPFFRRLILNQLIFQMCLSTRNQRNNLKKLFHY